MIASEGLPVEVACQVLRSDGFYAGAPATYAVAVPRVRCLSLVPFGTTGATGNGCDTVRACDCRVERRSAAEISSAVVDAATTRPIPSLTRRQALRVVLERSPSGSAIEQRDAIRAGR